MKAQLLGFIWETGKGITLADLFAHLQTLKGKRMRFGEHDRLLYVGEQQDYYVGLFLKIKDQRKSPEITETGSIFTVSIRQLKKGTNLFDFNFFVIHKSTGRGLYQYYHQSCSLNQFSIFCADRYEELKSSLIGKDLKPLGGEDASSVQKQRVEKKFKGSLSLENMVRKETLEKLLKELDEIKYFDFALAAIDDEDALVRPLQPYAKKYRRIVRFSTSGAGLVSAIVGIVKRAGITQGRVGGLDTAQREQVYRIIENPDKFGEFEYDDIADETKLNTLNVEKSPFFKTLLGIVKGSPEMMAIFETPVKP